MPTRFITLFLFFTLYASVTAQPALNQLPANANQFQLNNALSLQNINLENTAFTVLVFQEHHSGFIAENDRILPVLSIPITTSNKQVPSVRIISEQWVKLDTAITLPPSKFARRFDLLEDDVHVQPGAIFSISSQKMMRDIAFRFVHILPIRTLENEIYWLKELRFEIKSATANYQPQLLADALSAAKQNQPLKKRKPVEIQQFNGREFIKIEINETGIYRLAGDGLLQNNLPQNTPINQLRLYTYGLNTIPDQPGNLEILEPRECAIHFEDNGNAQLDADDALYFFGQAANDWQFDSDLENSSWSHFTNPYTKTNVYWLSWDSQPEPAKRMNTAPYEATSSSPDTTGFGYFYIENEIDSPLNSGREWYDAALTSGDPKTYQFSCPQVVDAGSHVIKSRFIGQRLGEYRISARINNNSLEDVIFNHNQAAVYPDYLYMDETAHQFQIEGQLQAQNNALNLRFIGDRLGLQLHVDWLEIFYQKRLAFSGGEVNFIARDAANAKRFSIQQPPAGIMAFDISQPEHPRRFEYRIEGENLLFTANSLREHGGRFLITKNFKSPARSFEYTFSDLRNPAQAAEMVIITPAEFRSQAEQLAAHRQTFSQLSTLVIDHETIINEFGWGKSDPLAIRNFLTFAFANWAVGPEYVLLFADGHFDYRNIAYSEKNWLPSFQTEELNSLDNRPSDIRLSYVSGTDKTPDLAIGRLPVNSTSEARRVVDKIIAYETDAPAGFWQSQVTLVADDEYGGGGRLTGEVFHTSQTESVAQLAENKPFNYEKIYLTEFREVPSSSWTGLAKPLANTQIVNAFNEGRLIINFIGHGNHRLWTHERVFNQDIDFVKLEPTRKQPFIIAATCEFARWDIPDHTAFPEDLLLEEDRGIIGILGSTRAVISTLNFVINRNFYQNLFDFNGEIRSIGDAILLSIASGGSTTNNEKYVLLGDPALKLKFPRHKLRVSYFAPDTILALHKAEISGFLMNQSNERLFENGEVDVFLVDARNHVTYRTENNGITRSVNYAMPGQNLYRGKAAIENGEFSTSFIIPKDVTYGGIDARLAVVGNGQNWDASGFRENIPISMGSAALQDNEGPEITISFNDQPDFFSGDPIPQQATMRIRLRDELAGINVTGSVGHKITLVLDEQEETPIDLTSDFVYDADSFQEGELLYTLPALSEGIHTAKIRAWDNANNSQRVTIAFLVLAGTGLQITDVMNYPNPFRDATTITYKMTYPAVVDIKIYTVAGRKIFERLDETGEAGFNQLEWDGHDQDGDAVASGVYLYKVEAKAQIEGKTERRFVIGKAAVQK